MFMPLTRRTGTREKVLTYTRKARVSTMSATPFASAIPALLEVGTPGDDEVKALNGC